MKRISFLTIIGSIFAVTESIYANKNKVLQKIGKGFKINKNEGRIHGHMQLKGVNANVLDVKISGTDTEGNLAIFEQTSLSQGKGAPLHVHPFQDEIFYVLDGNYRFKVGEEDFYLSTGESIFLPRKVPHAWSQASESGKMLVVLQPAGKLETFFVTMSSLDHIPSQKEVNKIFSDNEMEVVGPPLKI